MNIEEKKTFLIIGSSGGIGSVLIEHFSKSDINLALHYHTNKPASLPKNAKAYQADITNEEEVIALIDAVKKDFKNIDIVLHNAGVSRNGMSWKMEEQDWSETIAVNLTGPFLVSKHVIPLMRNNGFGRLIFMSSVVAQTGFIGTCAYASSKAGLIGLTKTLAKELANKNITSNAVALGYFNVGMINDVPEEMQNQLKKDIPIGKLGEPEQLAALIDFLSTEKSAYITGQTLNLNGGLYS